MKKEKLERIVICQEWEESEKDWGVRPDGCSLHKTIEDCQKYIKNYWKRMPKDSVPYEYSRTCGDPYSVKVKEDMYRKIARNKKDYGIRIWQHDLGELGDKTKNWVRINL